MPPRPRPSLVYSGTRQRASGYPRADDSRCRNQLLQLLPPAVMARLTAHLEPVRSLHRAGLVDELRGQITIRDRARLAAACCECYRLMRDEQYRLLGY